MAVKKIGTKTSNFVHNFYGIDINSHKASVQLRQEDTFKKSSKTLKDHKQDKGMKKKKKKHIILQIGTKNTQ